VELNYAQAFERLLQSTNRLQRVWILTFLFLSFERADSVEITLRRFDVTFRWGPLTPALSRGERVNLTRRGEASRPVCFPLRDAGCSLSLRERVRVRGNGAGAS